MDFIVKGVMIGGFALVAAPAEYRVTGVKTFIVSHDGVVYEKDLGPETLGDSRRWNASIPDKSWTPVWTSSSVAAVACCLPRRSLPYPPTARHLPAFRLRFLR